MGQQTGLEGVVDSLPPKELFGNETVALELGLEVPVEEKSGPAPLDHHETRFVLNDPASVPESLSLYWDAITRVTKENLATANVLFDILLVPENDPDRQLLDELAKAHMWRHFIGEVIRELGVGSNGTSEYDVYFRSSGGIPAQLFNPLRRFSGLTNGSADYTALPLREVYKVILDFLTFFAEPYKRMPVNGTEERVVGGDIVMRYQGSTLAGARIQGPLANPAVDTEDSINRSRASIQAYLLHPKYSGAGDIQLLDNAPFIIPDGLSINGNQYAAQGTEPSDFSGTWTVWRIPSPRNTATSRLFGEEDSIIAAKKGRHTPLRMEGILRGFAQLYREQFAHSHP